MAGPIQTYLVMLTPSILGLAAFVAGIWLLDVILRASDEPGVDVESCLFKILTISSKATFLTNS